MNVYLRIPTPKVKGLSESLSLYLQASSSSICEHPSRIQLDLTDPVIPDTLGCTFALAAATYNFQQTYCGCLDAVPRSEKAVETGHNKHKQREQEKSFATRSRIQEAQGYESADSTTICHVSFQNHPIVSSTESPTAQLSITFST